MENFHLLILQGNVLLLENIEEGGGGAACVNGCIMLMPITDIEVDETNNNVLPFTVNVPVL